MKKTITVLLALGLIAGSLIGPVEMAGAAKKKSGPVVVGKDDAGDWGAAVDPNISPAGDALGQDLVGAAIGMGEDGETVNFIIQLNSLPPSGGTPEVSRYTWDFTVDKGDRIQIDGKFTNYSRGTCDPTSGQCPPPRDPGPQPFLVRGNCHVEALVATNFTICEELANVQAIFDPAEGTITVPVPADAIKAKPGSKITGALGTFSTTVNAAPAAFATYGAFPMDGLITTKTFVVPR